MRLSVCLRTPLAGLGRDTFGCAGSFVPVCQPCLVPATLFDSGERVFQILTKEYQIMNPTPSAHTGQAAASLFQLADLADCFCGFPMETATKDTNQKVFLLQAPDLQTGEIPPELPRAIVANLPAGQTLLPGDIVIAQSGPAWRALPVAQPLAGTVCAAPLLVIRIKDQARLIPAWLCCYLHTQRVQGELRRYGEQDDAHEGVLSHLQALRLPVPPLEKQRSLCDFAAQFASMVQQSEATLAMLQQNNEATWLVLAHEWARAGRE